MARFTKSATLRNGSGHALASQQVCLQLHASNWDFLSSNSAGNDFRATVGGVQQPYWIAAWNQAAKRAVVFIKFASIPVGDSLVTLSGGDGSAAASSYDLTMQPGATDGDVYARFPLTEGSGTSIASTPSGYTGTLSGVTWVNTPGGGFGDGQVSPAFASGNFLRFNGTTGKLFIPELLATVGNIPFAGTISFWIRQPVINANGAVYLAVQRYGSQTIRVQSIGNNRISVFADTGNANGRGITFSDLPPVFGPSGVIDNTWRFVTLSWGGRGWELTIDGVPNYSSGDPSTTVDNSQPLPPKILTQDNSLGGPAAALSIGCLYDPRGGFSSNFAQIDVAELCIHARQLSVPEIDQLRHRMKVHPVETPSTRLNRRGIVITPTQGSAFNGSSWQEPNVWNDAAHSQLVMYVRAGYQNDGTGNGCRICRLTSSDGGKWSDPVTVLGMGTGGESGVAAGPKHFVDPVSGTHYIYYNGLNFTGLFYATSSDRGETFAKQGAVNLNGNPIATAPSAVGNTWVEYDGSIYHIFLESDYAGPWQIYHGTGSSPSNFTLDAQPMAGIVGRNNTSSGPALYRDPDGVAHLLIHDDAPSAIYHRILADDWASGTWSPYDRMIWPKQGMLNGYATTAINQTADVEIFYGALADGVQRTYLWYDVLAANTPAGIGLATYEGSPDDLFAPSVRLDLGTLPGSLDPLATVLGLYGAGTAGAALQALLPDDSGYPAVNAVKVGGKVANIFGNAGKPCTQNWTDSVSGQPVAGGAMWITSDPAGLHTVAGVAYTDTSGNVTFLLVPNATYYRWAVKAGETPVSGQVFVATAD